MRHATCLPGFTLVMLVLTAACSPGLESYADVTDLRVLGMQAEPPEILGDTAVSLNTNVTALVVDPRGGALQYTWSLCPLQSSLACDDFDTLTDTLDANTVALLQRFRAIGQSGTVAPTTADANNPSVYPIPAFNPSVASVALYGDDITPALWAYHAQYSTLLNFGLGAWPLAILTLTSSHGDTLVVTKRMVLGIQDYNSFASELAAVDVTLCTPTSAPPGCLNIARKTPNSNPNWGTVQASFAPALSGPGAYFTVGDSLALSANAKVRVLPSYGAGSEETYQTLRGALQGGKIEVESVTEMISVSWFFTEGSIENNLTQPLLQPTLENVYTSPVTFSGKPMALWLVLRDQRGGEAWRGIVLTPR